MDKYNQVMKRLLPALRDVVGIDFGTSATKAVRIKADAAGKMTVVAADVLPPCPMPAEGEEAPPAISVPRSLAAWTASLAFTSRKAVIKLVTEPKGTTYNQNSAPELLGLQKDHGLRIGLQRFENGEEKSVLFIGVPEEEVARLPRLMPSGRPMAYSAELAGLAALSCYDHVYGAEATEGCDLVMDFGAGVTTLGLFVRRQPLVLRQFLEGYSTVQKAVERDFQTDEATARDIILSGQVDISATLHGSLGGILRQTGIAVDFTERRTGAHLKRLFVSGGFARNPGLRAEIKTALSTEPIVVDPWKNMTVREGALSKTATETGASFAAATAAAIACLEEK